jgi:Tol biopolymer transport system component
MVALSTQGITMPDGTVVSTSQGARCAPRPRRSIATVLAVVALLGAATVATVVPAPAASAAGSDMIAAWYADAGCPSLAVFSPDATSLTDITIVVDCASNDLDILQVAHVTWSPDGSRLAFNGWVGGGNWFWFVVNVDGSGLEELCLDFDCSDPDNRFFRAWSADWGVDDHLYLSDQFNNRLVRMSMEDGSSSFVGWGGIDDQPETWNPALSPDGSQLAYHNFDDVFVAPVADLSDRTRLTPDSALSLQHTTWDASGTQVIYVERTSRNSDDGVIVRRSVSLPTDVHPLVADPTLAARSPAVSPDGSRMVFFDAITRDVYLVDLASDGPEGPFTLLFDEGSSQMAAFAWHGAGGPRAPRSPVPSIALTCEPSVLAVGRTVTCTVTGGDPGIDVLWRAAYNPAFAGAGVTLGADGTGSFSFVVPRAALGQQLTVELVEWTAPVSLGVVGAPVPASIPAGEGSSLPAGGFALLLALLGLTFPVALRRSADVTA